MGFASCGPPGLGVFDCLIQFDWMGAFNSKFRIRYQILIYTR
jgi:hypothetical protein